MINANSIKQRSIIASALKYEVVLEKIEDILKKEADQGKYLVYIDYKKLGIERSDCSSICNVLANVGFNTGITDDKKILISWYHDLDKINLLENYEKTI